jgi:hypothetical protein
MWQGAWTQGLVSMLLIFVTMPQTFELKWRSISSVIKACTLVKPSHMQFTVWPRLPANQHIHITIYSVNWYKRSIKDLHAALAMLILIVDKWCRESSTFEQRHSTKPTYNELGRIDIEPDTYFLINQSAKIVSRSRILM